MPRVPYVSATVLLIVMVVAAFVAATTASRSSKIGRAVVGHPVPGVVALVGSRAPQDDLYNDQFCAGVLVTARVVLTAAHCVEGREALAIHAVVAADNLCRGQPIDGIRIPVAEVMIHPRYEAVSGRFDLAQLVLDRAAPAELTRTPAPSPQSGAAVALGWGPPSPQGPPSCRLTRVALTVLAPIECAARLGLDRLGFDDESMVCAVPAVPGLDTCAGDSGGPLLRESDLEPDAFVGIVSWGRGCGLGTPGIYARASAWQ